jgi:hypothetical protein
MEPSTELKTLYGRICDAQSSGDHTFFERLFSKKEGVLAIGTDPTEWWVGHGTISKIFEAQLKEAGGFEIIQDIPLAHADGAVGWVAGRPTLKFPDGTEIPFRLTVVFQREPDGWKIVQWHSSVGISNEDLIGKTLTTK